MLPYLLIIGVSCLGAMGETSRYSRIKHNHPFMLIFFTALIPLVGFRFEVGSDWAGYLNMLDFASYNSFAVALTRSEPSYMIINWAAAKTGLGIEFVNLVCGAISCLSIYAFCKTQARPWLASFIMTSFFLIVVVIGLTRQGTAASIVFLTNLLDARSNNTVHNSGFSSC